MSASIQVLFSNPYPLNADKMALCVIWTRESRIKNGDSNTPFHLSVYDKRDDFSFRIVNFPHMDSNIPAYGVYISQLVRYVRICTSKLDFIHSFRRL